MNILIFCMSIYLEFQHHTTILYLRNRCILKLKLDDLILEYVLNFMYIRLKRNFVCLKFIILINYDLLIQGTLKIVEELKWKSFTLVVNGDEDGEDDTQNIAKKLTTAAIKNGFCVLISDGDKDGKTTILFFF